MERRAVRRMIFEEDEELRWKGHADADALLNSLEATGGVERRGCSDEFRVTPRGRSAVFVMGGDYLDKGPSNLRLLRVLKRLLDSDARVVLLAGNHDVRTLLAIAFAEMSHPTVAQAARRNLALRKSTANLETFGKLCLLRQDLCCEIQKKQG